MADHLPSAPLVAAMAAELWGETLGERRAAELAADLQRILGHARAAAAANDFNAEPNGLPVALTRLAHARADTP